MPQSRYWNLAGQTVAIVASILLAFGIQAWWEDRQEREAEQVMLASLQHDFATSRADLDRILQRYDNVRATFARYQSATPAELTSIAPIDIEPMLTSLVIGATFDPTTGTLDALIGDGRLGLISNSAVRESVSNWVRALEDIEENEVDLRSEALRVQRAMEIHGGPFQHSALSSEEFMVAQKANGTTLSALRQDVEFMGKVRSHHYTIAFYVRELRRLFDILNANLVLLEKLNSQD